MFRFGLCCLFVGEPVSFRTTTAKALSAYARDEQRSRLSALCLHNAKSLLDAVHTVHRLGIGAFRISSGLFPRYTHPGVGYTLSDLPEQKAIVRLLRQVKQFSAAHAIRLSLHPDQFTVLSSPHEAVVNKSVAELEYHAVIAKAVGAEVINIHGGGAYGDKEGSLKRFARSFSMLSSATQQRLTLENDDTTYTVKDLYPLCKELGVPLVYDVHHHRCNPDGLSITRATELAVETWTHRKQEPCFHLSSPRDGWESKTPKPHADYIDPDDVPKAWKSLRSVTIDVEAKAKELAVVQLKEQRLFKFQ